MSDRPGFSELLNSDDDERLCRDIADGACRHQPRNVGLHIGALSLSKTGDGFADPKIILPWALGAAGAPEQLAGLLVPIREGLALLPQMFTAEALRRRAVRKTFWVGAASAQGLCLLGMAAALVSLSPLAAGWAIVGLLALFSLARGVGSVASKDVLGKTVAKGFRGRVSGYAATVSGLAAGGLGLAYALGVLNERAVPVIAATIAAGGALWLIAALVYALVAEEPGATDGGASPIRLALSRLGWLRDRADLRAFVIARALLLGSALITPFVVIAAESGLGLLMVAAGAAGAVSSALWGGLSDRDSRLAMALGGAGAAGGGGAYAGASLVGLASGAWVAPAAIVALTIAHAGVRLGRKTYVVDIASSDDRSVYVAVGNTAIGVVLPVIGGLSAALALVSAEAAMLGLAILSLAGAAMALRLDRA